MPVINKLPHISLICEIMITPDAVANKLSGLNINKSMGSDGLHPRVLKELSPIAGISPRLLKEIVDDISVPLVIAFHL